jgi:hypothetical protein
VSAGAAKPVPCRHGPALLVAAVLVLAPRPPVQAAPQGHDIRLAANDQAQVGETRSLSLTIAAHAGYTISRDGPLYIDLASAGAEAGILELPRPRYQRSDAADVQAEAPRFDLRYIARAPGQTTVRVALFFWVCGPRVCWPVSESRDVHIDVHAGEEHT